ncbi:hypothetical protein PSTG_01794 [Puccinia striiformis f. sp. tritici PST-78]|uniref:Small-subunit processome Utp12 domain-containing protein n=1 Tax=Puccinia striiformis f. sp. tritici PST-78 TaxID=1165861 RepID=A0A0L0W0W8_9BASI|nr:hypothetical protein PSTG_01794 [Puccinia striiformis f. sp. tritici PST-78]
MAQKSTPPKSKKRAPRPNKKLKKDDQKQPEKPIISGSPPPSSASSSAGEEVPEKKKNDDADADDGERDVQEDETTTQSFADRLKILNLQVDSSNGPIEIHGSEDDDDDDDDLPGGTDRAELGNKMLGSKSHKSQKDKANSINPTTSATNNTIASIGSFAQTLTQALKSTDTKLLEICFLQQSKNNKNLISNTIQRLPKKLLHTLIEQIVICLNRKKRGYGDGVTIATVRRTKTLIEWVRQILIIHMSYLLTIPTLVTQLTTLHASLQKRLRLNTKLLSLNGRLELVLNQIELNRVLNGNQQSSNSKKNKSSEKNPKKNPAISVDKQEPYRYVEGESSGSEPEEKTNEDSDDGDDSDDESDDRIGDSDSEEEGSVEDVVLGSGSDEEDSENSDNEDVRRPGKIKKLSNGINDLLDLEADESGSEGGGGLDDDEDDDDDDDEEDDEEDSMDGFIHDGSDGTSDEDESD